MVTPPGTPPQPESRLSARPWRSHRMLLGPKQPPETRTRNGTSGAGRHVPAVVGARSRKARRGPRSRPECEGGRCSEMGDEKARSLARAIEL